MRLRSINATLPTKVRSRENDSKARRIEMLIQKANTFLNEVLLLQEKQTIGKGVEDKRHISDIILKFEDQYFARAFLNQTLF